MASRPREITAAAARYVGRKFGRKEPDQSWQEDGWRGWDDTPEVRFAGNYVGNAMSKARLFAGRRAADGTIEEAPDGHPSVDLVASIAGGPTGQAELLGEYGPHLFVAGEGWTVIRPTHDQVGSRVGEEWRVLSVLEITRRGTQLEAEIDGEPMVIPPFDPDNPDPIAPIAIRVWDPHPRRHIEADSPVRSSLGLLEELRLLNAAVAAIARSRLTGRGVLFVPQGTKFPTNPVQGGAEDDLLEVFMTVAETAYKEPESAAATTPIIVEVPAEFIGQIQHMKFESDFDELAIKLREETIRRFASGIEIPAEYLLGLSETNHWTLWGLQEESIRLAIEPRLATVADAFTKQWLRPMLEEQSVTDAHEFLVWYDTSPLRVRSNRSQTAIEVFREGGIGLEALRRETGFDDSDAPDPANEERDLLVRILTGAPSLAQQILPLLGIDLGGAVPAPDGAPAEAEPPAAPELPVSETTGPPDTLDQAASAASVTYNGELAVAVDGLIYHALDRAGEKLRRTPACPRSERSRVKEVAAASTHTLVPVQRSQIEEWRLLDGAWTRVPEVAERYGLDCDCLTSTLDDYCFELIAAGVEHTFDQTAGVLHAPCIAEAGVSP